MAPGAAVFVGIAALFTFATPYLDFTTKPLESEALLAAQERYENELGLPELPARVEEVSNDTEQANAYAYGMGPSRRIVFWDTMLREPFSEEEQKVVLAHELAHHSQEHLPKGLAWFALFAIPGAWILMRATRARGGMGAPEAVPLALLVVAVLQLVTAPAANSISRRMEAEADWKALQVTRDPPRSSSSWSASPTPRSAIPTRRAGRSSCSGRTPRSRTGSRWRARGRSKTGPPRGRP